MARDNQIIAGNEGGWDVNLIRQQKLPEIS